MRRILETVEGARVLALGAHPDDVELGAGGLLARLSRHGAQVTLAVVSVPTRLEERMREAEAGARALGARLLVVHGAEPLRVEDVPMHRLVARFDEVVGSVKPHLVITHSAHDLHWDHRLVHHATISSLRRTPCDLLAFLSSPEMNAHARSIGQCFADITESIEAKLSAISAHATQLGDGKFDLDAARDLARANGRICGVTYAESFEALRLTM